MLVKLSALGYSPPVWKNLVHHMGLNIPTQPLALQIVDASLVDQAPRPGPRTIPWSADLPDFLLVELSSGTRLARRISFLRDLKAQLGDRCPILVLVLQTLERGLGQLIQATGDLTLSLNNRAAFPLKSPDLLIADFPVGFPRLRVDDFEQQLRVRAAGETQEWLDPMELARGTLLSFSELAMMTWAGEEMRPEEWKKHLRRQSKNKGVAAAKGLIREKDGLFLFPGIPVGRVRKVELGSAEFQHVLDLGQLSGASHHFAGLTQAIAKQGAWLRDAWARAGQEQQRAEQRCDGPVTCAGPVPLLNETLRHLLRDKGYRLTEVQNAPPAEGWETAGIIVQTAPWPKKTAPPGNTGDTESSEGTPPVAINLTKELAPGLAPLAALTQLEQIPFDPEVLGKPLPSTSRFEDQRERLLSRSRKAEDGRIFTTSRARLLSQEIAVQGAAVGTLQKILTATDTALVWEGGLPAQVAQVLIFSHDREEAGTVLQALPGIHKKRWVDLSLMTTAERLQAFSLEPLQSYERDGMALMTGASRERTRTLLTEMEFSLNEAARTLQDNNKRQAYFIKQCEELRGRQWDLARRWVVKILRDWLAGREQSLLEGMLAAGRRPEHNAFSPENVRRIAIVSPSTDNRNALLRACLRVYPNLASEGCVVPAFDYAPMDETALNPVREEVSVASKPSPAAGESEPVESEMEQPDLDPGLFTDYARVIVAELEAHTPDLLVIEHSRRQGAALLDQLRSTLAQYRTLPVVMIQPSPWIADGEAALCRPHCRVLFARRDQSLEVESCVSLLHSLATSSQITTGGG